MSRIEILVTAFVALLIAVSIGKLTVYESFSFMFGAVAVLSVHYLSNDS